MKKFLFLVLTYFLFANFHIRDSRASKIASNVENNNIIVEQTSGMDIFDSPLVEPATINHHAHKANSTSSIRIIAMNKITAKTEDITLKLEESKYFGNIKIVAYKCHKKHNPYNVEYQALLSISEDKVDEENRILFQGWMFSSDLSISTFEHPVYEIFLKDCS
ncbi:MAG: DUF2155 domain-containing protein [Janthinobacterium lividum]